MISHATPILDNTGHTGNHLELTYFHWDVRKHELSAWFALYKDTEAFRSGKQPQKDMVANVRAAGDQFDRYFSVAALAAAGRDVVEQIGWVIKNVPDLVHSDYHSVEKPLFGTAGS